MGCILKGGGGLYSRLVVGAVLLAAGAGQRMGHRPKALLELGGVPLIRRQLIALSGAGIDEVVVVTGHHADAIEAQVQSFPVTLVRNPDPEAGQSSSMRLGLAALTGKLDAVIVALADQPLIQAQELTAVIGAYKKRPAGTELVVPQVDGQPGNPIMLSAAVREQILAGEASVGCRQWRAAHPDRVSLFVTDNRRFRLDVDTPEDLAAFERETGHALRWPAAWATAQGSTADASAPPGATGHHPADGAPADSASALAAARASALAAARLSAALAHAAPGSAATAEAAGPRPGSLAAAMAAQRNGGPASSP